MLMANNTYSINTALFKDRNRKGYTPPSNVVDAEGKERRVRIEKMLEEKQLEERIKEVWDD